MKRHFSANLADRPRICSNHNPTPKNLGTFVRIPQKVVGHFFSRIPHGGTAKKTPKIFVPTTQGTAEKTPKIFSPTTVWTAKTTSKIFPPTTVRTAKEMKRCFSANLAKRPRICPHYDQIRKNLGMFVNWPQKVVTYV